MPPSNLSRLVFTTIIAGQSLRHAGCLAPRRASLRRKLQPSLRMSVGQRRTFFGLAGFNDRRRKTATEPRLDLGMRKLQEHSKRVRLSARLNPVTEVRKALLDLFKYKDNTRSEVRDQQIAPILRAYEYVHGQQMAGDPRAHMDRHDLRLALKVLGQGKSHAHFEPDESKLCRRLILMLFVDLLKVLHDTNTTINKTDVYSCIVALCHCGQAATAREVLFAQKLGDLDLQDLPDSDQLSEAVKEVPFYFPDWTKVKGAKGRNLAIVLRGFRALGEEQQVSATLDMARSHDIEPEHVQLVVTDMIGHYAAQNDRQQARKWYSVLATAEETENEQSTTTNFSPAFYEKLVRCCLQTNDLEFGDQIVADLLARPSNSRIRDLVFVWAAGCGKGVEEVDRMMRSVEQSSAGDYEVSVNTMNSLISLALWRGNAYQAERFFHLFEKRGIRPNAHTYIMQIQYRLKEGDVDGALTSYSMMQSKTVSTKEELGEATESVNKLICAMCKTKRHDFESIMNIAGDLSDWDERFEAETVSTLAVLHISRAELDDAEDLLFTHAFKFSIDERQKILRTLIDHCKDDNTTTDGAWATYELLKNTFDDMDRPQRTELMNEFLKRQQGTLATQIFEHMRLHTRADTVPLVSTYVEAFHGIARIRDGQAFEAVYNLLKLDTSFEPSTSLYNALMVASIACQMPARALTFWEVITTSAEGPDLASIQLAFRACEFTNGGDNRARHIHRRLQASGLEMGSFYWGWLLAVLGAHGHLDEATALMSQLEQEQGLRPTLDMVGSFVDALASPQEQDQALKWAMEHVPGVHQELEQRLEPVDITGRRRYRLQDV